MRFARLPAALLAAAVAGPALAACPIELAVYRDRDNVAGIDFAPTDGRAAVANSFRMVMRAGPVFDGHVLWTDDPPRPFGQLLYQCPDGDVTGEEIAACTVWQGTVYAVADDGAVSLLPQQGEPAPPRLLLADLGYQMRWSATWELAALRAAPWDEFVLSGCQE